MLLILNLFYFAKQCVMNDLGIYLSMNTCIIQGQIQYFKLLGAHLKIEAEWSEMRNFLGVSCEKARFYAKKTYFFQF